MRLRTHLIHGLWTAAPVLIVLMSMGRRWLP